MRKKQNKKKNTDSQCSRNTKNMKIEMSNSVEASNPKAFALEISIFVDPIITKRSKRL